jgi:hypothetical protein
MSGFPTVSMDREATEIEVEVVEVDGVAPVVTRPRPSDGPARGNPAAWRGWEGRVRKLDSRWWPLWVFLGIIAVFLLLTVGLVVAVVFVITRLCLKLIRAVLR